MTKLICILKQALKMGLLIICTESITFRCTFHEKTELPPIRVYRNTWNNKTCINKRANNDKNKKKEETQQRGLTV